MAHIGSQAIEPDARAGNHLRRVVDGDHPPLRQALEQQLRDAAGVEHGLVPAQLQAIQRLGHRDLRFRHPVVGIGIPALHNAVVSIAPTSERSCSRS